RRSPRRRAAPALPGISRCVSFRYGSNLPWPLTPSSHNATEDYSVSSLRFRDRDRLDDAFRLRADQIDREQAVLEVCALHFHTLGQHEAALKLAGSDAAMEILAALICLLPAPKHPVGLLQRHIKRPPPKGPHRAR